MEALSAQINESVSVAVLDEFDIVYVARMPTKRIMRIGLSRLAPPCSRDVNGSHDRRRPPTGGAKSLRQSGTNAKNDK